MTDHLRTDLRAYLTAADPCRCRLNNDPQVPSES